MIKYEKEYLEKLILIENKSYQAIGKLYGVSGNAIKKAAKKFNIKLKQRRKINKNENFTLKHINKTNNKVYNVDDEKFIEIINTSTTWKDISIKIGYKKKLTNKTKELIINRCNSLNISPNIQKYIKNDITLKTKGELFENRKNWQSARTTIQRMARTVFKENNPNPSCKICGYNKHVEVAHIKAVAEFSDDTLITTINSIDNLIGLCPNHHWEYDNNMLDLKKLLKK
jgi:predicted restriction endonuclease